MSTYTAAEVIRMAREQNPGIRFAVSDRRTAIGAWSERLGRYQTVAGYCIDGAWRLLDTEFLMDGKPIDTYANADGGL